MIVTYAVDRLSRNQNHIGVLFDEVEQAGAKLQFVTEKFEDTAIGRFILAARAFIGEVEREKIAERTMRGKGERAKAGKIPRALASAATDIPMIEKPVLEQLPLRKQQLSGRYSLTSCQECPLFP